MKTVTEAFGPTGRAHSQILASHLCLRVNMVGGSFLRPSGEMAVGRGSDVETCEYLWFSVSEFRVVDDFAGWVREPVDIDDLEDRDRGYVFAYALEGELD